MKTEQTERDEKFYSSVALWKQAYRVTLGNINAYKLRLRELTTWDITNGTERERVAKITALQILINQK